MFKMGSHDPFWHLKYKLWPKEGSKIKLAISLSTTKSWESPQFPCVQVMCNILLELSQQRLQLCFRPHLNRIYAHKVMSPESHGSPNFGNFESFAGVPRQNDIWVLILWPCTKYIIRGKVVTSLKSEPWWILWIRICLCFVRAPEVFHPCTKNVPTMH
jgi:hypothetical protein